jgi:hypothetical protein
MAAKFTVPAEKCGKYLLGNYGGTGNMIYFCPNMWDPLRFLFL